jgi:FAD:protein FMN transferase
MAVRLRLLRLSATVLAAAAVACAPPPAMRTVSGIAQGTTYSLQWSGGDAEPDVARAAEQELDRIDALLSNYRADSTLEQFNAGPSFVPSELPSELVTLFGIAKTVHEASYGCFDPTVRPLVRVWGFDTDHPAIPSPAALDAARESVGLDHLEIIDGAHARKTAAGLELDMASIGQGYTAERLAAVLENHGSNAYLAEIGGEIVARGTKPDSTPWRIGVENPSPESQPGPTLRMPAETRTAVITSGTYQHYFEAGDRRFSHIIDPRTGQPVDHALLAVTVAGRDAATTAAWATALLCLGPRDAAAIADREGLAALLWIDRGDEPATLERSQAFVAEWQTLLEEPATR